MDIDLYYNSVYSGFYPLDYIIRIYNEYYAEAVDLAQKIDWDEVVLYAIFSYDESTQGFVSADFMLLRMTYKRYTELCLKISKNCRLFFIRNS